MPKNVFKPEKDEEFHTNLANTQFITKPFMKIFPSMAKASPNATGMRQRVREREVWKHFVKALEKCQSEKFTNSFHSLLKAFPPKHTIVCPSFYLSFFFLWKNEIIFAWKLFRDGFESSWMSKNDPRKRTCLASLLVSCLVVKKRVKQWTWFDWALSTHSLESFSNERT